MIYEKLMYLSSIINWIFLSVFRLMILPVELKLEVWNEFFASVDSLRLTLAFVQKLSDQLTYSVELAFRRFLTSKAMPSVEVLNELFS